MLPPRHGAGAVGQIMLLGWRRPTPWVDDGVGVAQFRVSIALTVGRGRNMAERRNIWVTREAAENAWAVRRENSPRRLGTFRTQAEAKTAGRERAQRDKVELIWQGKDGQIAGRNSYGHDDRNRKG
jgi:hypothetical protein